MSMIKKNDVKKDIWNETVFDYTVYSTSTTTQPTLPWPHPQQEKTRCALWRQFSMGCFVFNDEHKLDYQTLSGKEPMLFLRRNKAQTWESGGNQAYYEHSVQEFVTLWYPSCEIIYSSNKNMYNSQCLFCHTNIAKCHTLLTEDYCLTTTSSPHPGRFLCSGFLECLHDWHPKNSCRGDYHPGGGGMDISGTAHSDL